MRSSRYLLMMVWLVACGGAPGSATSPPADPLAGAAPGELYARGVAFAQRSDFVRAEQYLSAAIERGYDERLVLPRLIEVCLASSQFRSALRYALPYLDRHPRAWSLRYLVATIYLGVGDVERARIELERVVADAPDRAAAHYLLGVVFRDELGDRPRARAAFERYLELDANGRRRAEVVAALSALAAPPGSEGAGASTGPGASESGTTAPAATVPAATDGAAARPTPEEAPPPRPSRTPAGGSG